MLEVTRLIDSPPASVFAAWTDPERVKQWWGPKGFTTPVCTIDPHPGGAWLTCMRSPEGRDYWCKGVYREIVADKRIVTTDFFADETGNPVPPTRYGMAADWPAETLITVDFAEQEGKTRLTVRQTVPDPLVADSGAVQGWSESLDRLAATVTRSQGGCPGMSTPQAEHRWLHRLVGEWTSEGEAAMAADQPPAKFKGRESVRSLGGLWVIGEGRGEMPDGGEMSSVITFGYDPDKAKFVGTFIASVGAHLWLYEGTLNGDVLTLDTEGPDFIAAGKMARYRDVVEWTDDDHRILTSHRLGEDGRWQAFMTAHYRRTR